MIALGVVGHAVEVTQVPDIPEGSDTMTCLYTAQLTHGEQELGGSLFGRETFFQPKPAQQGA